MPSTAPPFAAQLAHRRTRKHWMVTVAIAAEMQTTARLLVALCTIVLSTTQNLLILLGFIRRPSEIPLGYTLWSRRKSKPRREIESKFP